MSIADIVQQRPEGIYTRMMKAVQARGAFHARAIDAGLAERGSPELPTIVFIGRSEWRDLEELCKAWNVEWAGSAPGGYNPDQRRAEFMSFKIYCVDAESFLAAL